MDILEDDFVNFVMCRACMLHIDITQPDSCKPLFSYRFAEMFTKCTNIKVDVCDGLPAQVCSKCFQTLRLVYSFKEQCIASDLKLKGLLKANHPGLASDPLLISEYVAVSEIKLEDDYFRDETKSTSTVFELSKDELKSESNDDDDASMGHTNMDTDASEFVITQHEMSAKPEDEKNSSQEIKRVLDAGKKIAPKKLKVIKKVKKHTCVQCERNFTQTSSLKRHIATHNNKDKRLPQIKNFKCDVCNKPFATLAYLKQHKKIHTKVHPYVCDLCGLAFSRKDRLNAHKRSHDSGIPIPCIECDKTFKTLYTLKIHKERKHICDKNLVCDFCGKMFFNRSDFSVHRRIHTKEKPHECSYCKKRFVTKSHLIVHIRIHTGSRPYACDVCPKTFARCRVLKNHRMTHTGERPHVCVVCQRAFIQRFALKMHMKVHTGTPPSDRT